MPKTFGMYYSEIEMCCWLAALGAAAAWEPEWFDFWLGCAERTHVVAAAKA